MLENTHVETGLVGANYKSSSPAWCDFGLEDRDHRKLHADVNVFKPLVRGLRAQSHYEADSQFITLAIMMWSGVLAVMVRIAQTIAQQLMLNMHMRLP
jgi:hypothetical protein